MTTNFFIRFIDQFYFLFRRFMPIKMYRYGVCGGSNLMLDTLLYFLFFQFVFKKEVFYIGEIALSAHIASLFAVFPITFLSGFLLNRFVVFSDSGLPIGKQFFRYLIVGSGAILLSYGCMKFFVDGLAFYPTPSRLLTICITVLYSYILQNKFSFKVASNLS